MNNFITVVHLSNRQEGCQSRHIARISAIDGDCDQGLRHVEIQIFVFSLPQAFGRMLTYVVLECKPDTRVLAQPKLFSVIFHIYNFDLSYYYTFYKNQFIFTGV